MEGSGKSKEEEERDSQNYYERRLDMMKNYIIGYVEELDLLIDTNKKNSKLTKLEREIEEKKLEAERRKTVVETKVYGAEIEIITILREELKQRSENAKVVTELNAKITQIQDMLSQMIVGNSNQKLEGCEEDRWYSDIVKKQSTMQYGSGLVINAKRTYSKIKILKEEINELSKQLQKLSLDSTDFVIKDHLLTTKKHELTKEMQNLAEQWSLNS
jgi:hypothetical protein